MNTITVYSNIRGRTSMLVCMLILLVITIPVIFVHCSSTSRLLQRNQAEKVRKYDLDRNGKIDNWQYYLNVRVMRCEHDDTGDGIADRIEYFDKNGLWITEELVNNDSNEKSVRKISSSSVYPLDSNSTGITPPKILKTFKPEYPFQAKTKKMRGQVCTLDINFVVTDKGKVAPPYTVRCKEKTKADRLFIHSALDAIKMWQFEPAMLEGKPVAVNFMETVSFSLE